MLPPLHSMHVIEIPQCITFITELSMLHVICAILCRNSVFKLFTFFFFFFTNYKYIFFIELKGLVILTLFQKTTLNQHTC